MARYIITLVVSLGLAAIAGWFAVAGMITILQGQIIAGLVLGIGLECGKLVSVSWLYWNWKESPWALKAPMLLVTTIIMVLTSLGVYGFITKAHLEHGSSTINHLAKVEDIQRKIDVEKLKIEDLNKVVGQLDTVVNTVIAQNRPDRAAALRKTQDSQRNQLSSQISEVNSRINELNDEKFKFEADLRQVEHEVGVLKYVAQLFSSENSDEKRNIQSAMTVFTLLVVLALDPLAILLLISANFTMKRMQEEKIAKINAINEVKRDPSPPYIVETPTDASNQTSGPNVPPSGEPVRTKRKYVRRKPYVPRTKKLTEPTKLGDNDTVVKVRKKPGPKPKPKNVVSPETVDNSGKVEITPINISTQDKTATIKETGEGFIPDPVDKPIKKAPRITQDGMIDSLIGKQDGK